MRKNFFTRFLYTNEFILFLILIVLTVGMGIINPKFVSPENLFDILRSASFLGVLSIGFLLVLISGCIDISFTATATVAQYITAVILTQNQDMPVILVIMIPILIGLMLGTLVGYLVDLLNVPSIIISIAMLNVYYGAIQFFSAGHWIYSFPSWVSNFPKILVLRFEGEGGAQYGLSIFTVIWFVVALLGYLILEHTTFGRKIFAIGGNLEAARRAGINITTMRLYSFGFLGAIAGLGALLHTLITQTAAPNALLGQEFDVVTAVVLGGTLITGGSGTVLGTMLGVLLVAEISNGLTLLKVPAYWHQVCIGLILLISVISTATRTRIKNRRLGGIDVAQ